MTNKTNWLIVKNTISATQEERATVLNEAYISVYDFAAVTQLPITTCEKMYKAMRNKIKLAMDERNVFLPDSFHTPTKLAIPYLRDLTEDFTQLTLIAEKLREEEVMKAKKQKEKECPANDQESTDTPNLLPLFWRGRKESLQQDSSGNNSETTNTEDLF